MASRRTNLDDIFAELNTQQDFLSTLGAEVDELVVAQGTGARPVGTQVVAAPKAPSVDEYGFEIPDFDMADLDDQLLEIIRLQQEAEELEQLEEDRLRKEDEESFVRLFGSSAPLLPNLPGADPGTPPASSPSLPSSSSAAVGAVARSPSTRSPRSAASKQPLRKEPTLEIITISGDPEAPPSARLISSGVPLTMRNSRSGSLSSSMTNPPTHRSSLSAAPQRNPESSSISSAGDAVLPPSQLRRVVSSHLHVARTESVSTSSLSRLDSPSLRDSSLGARAFANLWRELDAWPGTSMFDSSRSEEPWTLPRPVDGAPRSDSLRNLCRVSAKFNYETDLDGILLDAVEPEFEGGERQLAYFERFFAANEPVLFMGFSKEKGPCVVAVESARKRNVRCLVRLKDRDVRLLLPKADKKLLQARLPELKSVALAQVGARDPYRETLSNALVQLDNHHLQRQFKFGVLYVAPGQTTEEEFYGNNEPASPMFADFLNFLGETVPQQGWEKFRGGLNVKDGSTGEKTVYTEFFDNEIMFHVAHMLPFTTADEQQLQRKRHLGNDIIVILFKEESDKTPFDPEVMRSQVNHIFLVVQPLTVGGQTHYRTEWCFRVGVPMSGPRSPSPLSALAGPRLRNHLLCKMINAELSCLTFAPFFTKKNQVTRERLLQHMLLGKSQQK